MRKHKMQIISNEMLSKISGGDSNDEQSVDTNPIVPNFPNTDFKGSLFERGELTIVVIMPITFMEKPRFIFPMGNG